MNIEQLYKKWADGENDHPFTKSSEWRGDMVKGFVKFCLKENLTKHNSSSKKDCSQCANYSNETCSYGIFKNLDGDCQAFVKRSPS